MRKIKLFLLMGCLVVCPLVGGCASHRTVRSQSVTYPADAVHASEPIVVERQTTTTETTDTGSSGGVLSSTVNAVGEVIALPFRVVGGIISAIF
ncbi:MAG TPA: hypothetical protein VNN62_01660 [Methylomirabilota bacterium]|nr:hypothetical protein [Methylomirabilota bacterium]